MAQIETSTLRIGSNDLVLQDSAVRGSLANAYSASSTYAVGDIVLKDGQLYKCNTAISTAEAWTAAHWTAVTVGGELSTVKDGLSDLEETVSHLDGVSEDVKQALLQIASKVVYIDEHGQDYYDALESALYPPAELVSISAVYTQSGTVYSTDSLDSLKSDLVVTALYDDQTTATVTTYTLSGTLTEGTSTVTVTYGGKTTTFSVTVTEFTTSPILEYTDSDIQSGGKISTNTTGFKGVTKEYEVDEVSSSARHLVIAMFFPWTYTGSGSGYQNNYFGCYLSGQDAAQANGERFSCNSTYGLDSEGNLQTLATRRSNLKANTERIRFTLPYVADYTNIYQQNAKEYCYAYIEESGYILFAGSETPYYGKRYITD